MQITDVRVRKVAKEGKLKAVVSITMDEEFVVHDIKVIEGEKGLFIAMPSKRALDGEYRDIAHPINSGTRDRIQKIILDKYAEVLEETDDAETAETMEKLVQTSYEEGDSSELLTNLVAALTSTKLSGNTNFYILRNDISTTVNRA